MISRLRQKWFTLQLLVSDNFSYWVKPLMPKAITIEFTYNCNLRCAMCPRQIYNFSNKEMSLEQIEHILDEIPSLRKINFCGLGEPFCHRQFFEILELCKARRKKVTFVTNGVLMTEKNIKKLPENIHLIHVSLDTYDTKEYKEIRGTNLDKTVENIKRLHKLRPDIRIVLNCILMKKTLVNYHNLLKLAKDVDAEVCMLNLQVFWEGGQKEQVFEMPHLKEKLLDFKHKAEKLGVRYTLRSVCPIKAPCKLPFTEPYINIDGDIYPCSYVWVDRVHERPYFKEWLLDEAITVPQYEFVMGNIFRDKFRDIWFSSAYQKLRSKLKNNKQNREYNIKLFNNIRRNFKFKDRFDYCKICLVRFGMAC